MNLSVSTPSFYGTMTAPSSKSHTLRALICASLADDTSFITAPLISGDMESAIQVVQQLGVTITEVSNNPLVLKVTPPVGGLLASAERGATERILDLGNSGLLFRHDSCRSRYAGVSHRR